MLPYSLWMLDTSAYNFNNYYSNLNINPATEPYNNGDETSLDFGANMPQDSVYSSLFMMVLVMELM